MKKIILISLMVILCGCEVHLEYDPETQSFYYRRVMMQPENITGEAILPDGTKVTISVGENATQAALVNGVIRTTAEVLSGSP